MGFNALEFFPDHPDEMGLWPRGGATPGIKTPVIPDEPDVLDAVDGAVGSGRHRDYRQTGGRGFRPGWQ